jgi:hypothetical protein
MAHRRLSGKLAHSTAPKPADMAEISGPALAFDFIKKRSA